MKKLIVLAAMGLLITFFNDGLAQDPIGVRYESEFLDYWQNAYDVLIHEDSIYVATSTGLRIFSFDVWTFDSVRVIRAYRCRRLFDMGEYLVMSTADNRLMVAPFDDLDNPVGSIATPSIQNYGAMGGRVEVLSESRFFYLRSFNVIQIVDLSNPEEPENRGSYSLGNLGFNDTYTTLDVEGDYLYATGGTNRDNNYLAILDISDLDSPQPVERIERDEELNFVAVHDTLMLLLSTGVRGEELMTFFNISDPIDPQEIASVPANAQRDNLYQAIFSGDTLYIGSSGSPSKWIISDLENPVYIGSNQGFIGGERFAIAPGAIFSTLFSLGSNGGGLASFIPEPEGRWHDFPLAEYVVSYSTVSELFINSNRLFIFESAAWVNDLMVSPDGDPIFFNPWIRVFDIRNPLRPGNICKFKPMERNNWDDSSLGGEAFVTKDTMAYYTRGLGAACYSMSSLGRNPILFEFAEDQIIADMEIHDNLLVTSGDGLVVIYDISDPSRVQVLSGIGIESHSFSHLIIDDNIIYASNGIGIFIISIDDPAEPRLLSHIEQPSGRNFALHENHLFSTTYEQIDGRTEYDFIVHDVSNPAEPRVVTREERALAIGIAGQYGKFLLLNSQDVEDGVLASSFKIMDVTDPENLEMVGRYPGYLYSPVIYGRILYAIRDGRVSIFDVSEAIGFNDPPVWDAPPAPIAVPETDTVFFILTATDPNEDDELRLSVVENTLPRGAFFTDLGNCEGVFDWLTDFTSAGQYWPAFIVTDGELTDTTFVRITVNNVNHPPFLAHPIPDVVCYEGDTLFTIARLDTVFSDEDLDTLRFAIVNNQARSGLTIRYPELMMNPRTALANQLFSAVISARDHDIVFAYDTFSVIVQPLSASSDFILQPSAFILSAYPNPFNSSTTITFSVQQASLPVRLSIFDLSGRLVADLLNGRGVLQYAPTAGEHKVVWDAGNLESGVYLVRLEGGGKSIVRKALLLR